MVEAVNIDKGVITVQQRKVTLSTSKNHEYDDKQTTTVQVDVAEAIIPLASTFKERKSPLDLQSLEKTAPQVRGFLALFWITITMYGVISLYRNAGGGYFGMTLKLWRTSYADHGALVAMIAWAYLNTYLVLPYQWLVSKGWLGKEGNRLRVAIRLLLEVTPIAFSLFTAKYRAWPPLQTGTFSLFTLSMSMKIHAFLTVNAKLDRHYQAKTAEGKCLQAKNPMAYPNNISIKHFTTYLWMPTYIYSLEYPRTKRINWAALAERTAGIIVTISLYYIVIEQHILPVLHAEPPLRWIDAYIDLILPCLACTILVFFMVWDYMLNWAAEITFFADRQFYSDWWNCLDMAEFARKWNVPVHKFLQTYVYRELSCEYGLRKDQAMIATFLVSSIFHEFVLSSMAGKMRLWILGMQMMQVPLIYAANKIGINRYPFVANLAWWMCMVYGVPLIVMLYSRN